MSETTIPSSMPKTHHDKDLGNLAPMPVKFDESDVEPLDDDEDVRRKPTIESCTPWSRDNEENPVAKHRAGLGKIVAAERQRQADEAKARMDIHGHFAAFCESCRDLKTAEAAFKAAQLAYAEAVKKLSEEAVK